MIMRTTFWLFLAVVVLFTGCSAFTDALRAVGIPVGPGTDQAARGVDAAISNWFLYWLGGVATSEGTRASVKGVKAGVAFHRRRKATKASKQGPGAPLH